VGLTLLDSSVISALLNSRDSLHEAALAALEREAQDRQHFAVSAVTWSEVLTGAQLVHGSDRPVRAFADDARLVILEADQAVAEEAARLRVAYAKRPGGGRLRTADALILATGATHPDVNRIVAADGQWAKIRVPGSKVVVIQESGT